MPTENIQFFSTGNCLTSQTQLDYVAGDAEKMSFFFFFFFKAGPGQEKHENCVILRIIWKPEGLSVKHRIVCVSVPLARSPHTSILLL